MTEIESAIRKAEPIPDFVSAGFLVTREIVRPDYMSAELLPDRFISASGCMGVYAPNTWCIEWTEDDEWSRVEIAEAFGLNSQTLAEITAWVTRRFGESIRWPNVVADLETAKEIVVRFLSDLPDVRVLELGLHRSMLDEFCRKAEPPPQTPGFAPMGRHGAHEVILNGRPLAQGGQILGFEPLVFDKCLSCSWLCNGLENDMEQVIGVRPNLFGLIGNFEDARRYAEYISSDDVGAEPGLWLPWLIVDHSVDCALAG